VKKLLFVFFCLAIAILIFVIVVFLLGTRPEKGALQVTSSPKASVYLNDKLMGATPLCLCDSKNMLKVGEYIIRVVPAEGNFEPFQRRITINPKVLTVVDRSFSQTALSQASIITLNQIQDKKDAQISTISFPSDANFFVDGVLAGKTPTVVKNQTESDHEIKVTKEGYKDKTVRIRAILGYRLEAIVYLGIDPDVASSSAAKIPTPSVTPSTTKPMVLILDTPTGFLRVRDAASVSGAEIGQVKPGETYELISEETNWFEIKLKTGETGWISSQYAKKQS
jgi:hypothetical protein